MQSEEQQAKVASNEIVIPTPARLGNDVVIAKKAGKAFGEKLLFDDLNFSLPRGGIVGTPSSSSKNWPTSAACAATFGSVFAFAKMR